MSQNPWSERAQDWADVLEGWNGWGVPVYRRVLERVGVERVVLHEEVRYLVAEA